MPRRKKLESIINLPIPNPMTEEFIISKLAIVALAAKRHRFSVCEEDWLGFATEAIMTAIEEHDPDKGGINTCIIKVAWRLGMRYRALDKKYNQGFQAAFTRECIRTNTLETDYEPEYYND